jgi:hypothetical protein
LGDEGFGFGEDVVRRDVVEGAESFWIGVGDIGDMEIGLRVGEGVWSDFLLFHVLISQIINFLLYTGIILGPIC